MIHLIRKRLAFRKGSNALKLVLWFVISAFTVLSLVCPIPVVSMDGHFTGAPCDAGSENGGCSMSIGHHVSVWLAAFASTPKTDVVLFVTALFLVLIAWKYLRHDGASTYQPPNPLPYVLRKAHVAFKESDHFIKALSAGIIRSQIYNV